MDDSSGAPILAHWVATVGKADLGHIADITTLATPRGRLDAISGRGVKRYASQGFLSRPSTSGRLYWHDWSKLSQKWNFSQNENELVVVSADENAEICVSIPHRIGAQGAEEIDQYGLSRLIEHAKDKSAKCGSKIHANSGQVM